MPRGRGGPRQGRPGVAHGNRTDLNAPKLMAVPSPGYGQGVAQLEAQRAVPMGRSPVANVPAPTPGTPEPGAPNIMGAAAGYTFPQMPPLDRPTENPDEPLTAGAPFGPGAGPEALGIAAANLADQLRVLYRAEPDEDLRELIEELDRRQAAF